MNGRWRRWKRFLRAPERYGELEEEQKALLRPLMKGKLLYYRYYLAASK